MKRTYECMILLDNREVRQGWEQTKERVGGMLTKHGAEIVSSKRWAERRLAYPIRSNLVKHLRGTYLLVYMSAETGSVAAMRRELELSEIALRHVILGCEKVPETAHAPEEEFDETAVQFEEVSTYVPEPKAAEPEERAESGEAAEGDGEGAEKAEKTDAAENAENAEAAEGAAEGEAASSEPAAAAEEASKEESATPGDEPKEES